MTACPFITTGHPFESAFERIRSVLGRPQVAADPNRTPRHTKCQNELKGVRGADGAWRIERFYSSAHSWNESADVPFSATTYLYSPAAGGGQWFEFPQEPYLGALAHLTDTGRPEILQYVVLRRLTFRATADDGSAYIGKFKRRSRAYGAFDALWRVADAARGSSPSFRVPVPLSFDESKYLFRQEVLTGSQVNVLVTENTMESLLFGVGRVQAELHGLPVSGLARSGQRVRLAALAQDCDWIGFFRPRDGVRLAAVRDVLLNTVPTPAGDAPAMCHGDFVCSHVLHDRGGWGVIDFDLAHYGDRHADASLLLSSLTEDVPLLRDAWRAPSGAPAALLERAVAAFVRGYQSYGGRPLARRPLLWHRIAAEIHVLALMFTKDRFHSVAFDRSLEAIERLAAQLSQSREGAA